MSDETDVKKMKGKSSLLFSVFAIDLKKKTTHILREHVIHIFDDNLFQLYILSNTNYYYSRRIEGGLSQTWSSHGWS